MNIKTSFFFGFIFASFLSGVGFYLMSSYASKHSESTFMAGYALEASTLSFILGESDNSKRIEIARSELCEAIIILNSKFKKGSFDVGYFEVVTSMSVSEYQSQLKNLYGKYC